MKKRVIALALGCTVAFGCAVGGTLAWLTDSTDAVKNVFTTSDVDIELTEDTKTHNEENQYNFKMVPGDTFAKDPKVTVTAGSENCWLFIHVEENEGSWSTLSETVFGASDTALLQYNIATGWIAVPDHAGYYYRTVSTNTENQSFYILAGTTPYTNGQITIDDSVTKTMMEMIDGKNADGTTNDDEQKPTLTFSAAAIQSANLPDSGNNGVDVNDAWAQLPAEFTGTTSTN